MANAAVKVLENLRMENLKILLNQEKIFQARQKEVFTIRIWILQCEDFYFVSAGVLDQLRAQQESQDQLLRSERKFLQKLNQKEGQISTVSTMATAARNQAIALENAAHGLCSSSWAPSLDLGTKHRHNQLISCVWAIWRVATVF